MKFTQVIPVFTEDNLGKSRILINDNFLFYCSRDAIQIHECPGIMLPDFHYN